MFLSTSLAALTPARIPTEKSQLMVRKKQKKEVEKEPEDPEPVKDPAREEPVKEKMTQVTMTEEEMIEETTREELTEEITKEEPTEETTREDKTPETTKAPENSRNPNLSRSTRSQRKEEPSTCSLKSLKSRSRIRLPEVREAAPRPSSENSLTPPECSISTSEMTSCHKNVARSKLVISSVSETPLRDTSESKEDGTSILISSEKSHSLQTKLKPMREDKILALT